MFSRGPLSYKLLLSCVTLSKWSWLNDWLTDRPTDWPTDWLTDRLTNRLTDWLADWLTDRWADGLHCKWLTDWLIDWLIDRSIDRSIDQSIGQSVSRSVTYLFGTLQWYLRLGFQYNSLKNCFIWKWSQCRSHSRSVTWHHRLSFPCKSEENFPDSSNWLPCLFCL